ncbi:hypothetical protein [Gordonia rubripertincta]|uniref:Low molecular weight antigen MTB12-like C-terminal domain-containing protein n=1 Tax=Gordonia rubripertincta TaxID=36822 RepID=A0ABT4MW93_GORRU|nr:hypothetical protein [Gordonia rubripertincta]MCZ4551280.1 hypothetical protein [Gordonia rubripertincta]
MRNQIVRRALTAGACAAVLVGLVAGCSDDSSDSSSSSTAAATSSAAAASSTAAAADPAITEAVTTAYETFFDGTAPIEERSKYVENSAVFGPVLQGMTANPQAAGTSAVVKEVTLESPDKALVTWDLKVGDSPGLPDQSGEAVLVDGTWVVAGVTFCTILAVQGSGAAVPGC